MKASQRCCTLGTSSVPMLPALGAEGLCNVTGLGEQHVQLMSRVQLCRIIGNLLPLKGSRCVVSALLVYLVDLDCRQGQGHPPGVYYETQKLYRL